MALLEMTNIKKSFDGVEVLKNISLYFSYHRQTSELLNRRNLKRQIPFPSNSSTIFSLKICNSPLYNDG